MPDTKNIIAEITILDAASRTRPLAYKSYVRLQESLRRTRRELLLFCQHAPTLTAGVKSRVESLLEDPAALAGRNIAHVRIGRGGDYTAHEPGQCVIYPHVDLRARRIPVSEYFNRLLEITRESIDEVWRIRLENHADAPGLYTPSSAGEGHALTARKLASIGIMFKSFFSSFGLAVNVRNSLETFQYINPCGDANLSMTTIAGLGGDPHRLPVFIGAWSRRFHAYMEEHPPMPAE